MKGDSKKMAIKTVAQGISETIKWTLDEDGTLSFEPTNGTEGTFEDAQKSGYEWEKYNKSIKQIKSNGKINLASDSADMFYGCSSLTDIAGLKNWNTHNVTNMSYMFYGCSSLTALDALKNWDTTNVTNTDCMFFGDFAIATVGLSATNKKIVSELPSNETSTFSSKWHKEGTTSLYRISWLGEDWDNSYEGTWSREKAQN